MFFNWGGGSIEPFVKADLLLPLDDLIKKDPGLKSNFLPSVFETAAIDGTPYGVPMRGTQPVLLFNNKKVLAAAGIEAPRTWEDLLDAVKKLKADGVTPIALGGGDKWTTMMWFEYLYDRVAGPELFKKALQRLVGYLRVPLEAGEEARIAASVPADVTSFTGRDGRRVVEPASWSCAWPPPAPTSGSRPTPP